MVGFQIAVEPEWSRVDDAGKLVTTFEAETRIIADTELVPDRLFAAFNLIYTPEIAREFGSPDWKRMPEEFESKTLRVEKVVAGNSEITLKFRPLAPGRYRFYGDFNEATAEGALTTE